MVEYDKMYKPRKMSSKSESSKSCDHFDSLARGKVLLEAILLSTILIPNIVLSNDIVFLPEIDNTVKAGDYVSGWKTCTENDRFKYIPLKAYENKQVYIVGDINQNGVNDLYWYDKNNDKTIDEIYELYIDLNEDGIVDVPMSYIAGLEAEC